MRRQTKLESGWLGEVNCLAPSRTHFVPCLQGIKPEAGVEDTAGYKSSIIPLMTTTTTCNERADV